MTTSEYEPIPLADAIEKVVTRLKGENPDPGQVSRITEEVMLDSQTDVPHSSGLTDDERFVLDSISERLGEKSE